MKKIVLVALWVCLLPLSTQAQRQFVLTSPNGQIIITVDIDHKITYSVTCNGERVIDVSPLSLTLSTGEVWGDNVQLSKSNIQNIQKDIPSPFYWKDRIADEYTELVLTFKKQWGVEFRAYNDGVAYRFVNQRKKPFTVQSEEVVYNFGKDVTATVPYVNVGKDGDYKSQFMNSFENTYVTGELSQLNKGKLMFLPLLVNTVGGKKVCVTEVDLESYPGLYLTNAEGNNTLSGIFAAYPKETRQGGHNMLQSRVREREAYIAQVNAPRTFPWRVAIITKTDKELADSDMTYKLASSSRVPDISWIKPGKVAWDWWNDWNIDGVDFVSGINNNTYKYYIDFAAANGIEYVILDEGWAVNLQADLMQVVKEIDMKELVDYAAEKNVGIILWAGYYAFNRDMEEVCRHYSQMGVKGFKVDFMDRDDQEMVEFVYRAADACAKYHLVLDLHGMYKPAGLNRTYPNVLNVEGVFGLEQMKWSPASVDQVKYDVTIPFIRQVAGPLDYTQGAMRNAAHGNYYPCDSEPMSQGTRCRQLATYVVFYSPLNMLCDTPGNYQREAESLAFIATVPTVWNESITLDGKQGEYIVTARRHGNTWYIGGLTNWEARDITVDLSFLKGKRHSATLFRDGTNAHRIGRDYKKETLNLDNENNLPVHLAPGGGFVLIMDVE
ncbi:alpha-glucosidase [termite gut metagenome]|uniref:Alpha-glucosidase n=1 Tax=termite gut metagenome TaxID=433724 RepID=A0A5J4SBR4_9ZZZZ